MICHSHYGKSVMNTLQAIGCVELDMWGQLFLMESDIGKITSAVTYSEGPLSVFQIKLLHAHAHTHKTHMHVHKKNANSILLVSRSTCALSRHWELMLANSWSQAKNSQEDLTISPSQWCGHRDPNVPHLNQSLDMRNGQRICTPGSHLQPGKLVGWTSHTTRWRSKNLQHHIGHYTTHHTHTYCFV